MSGVELRDGTLIVERSPNELDDLALAFSEVLTRLEIDHVFIAGYVAILTGRARATEDIDVLIEEVPASKLDQLVEVLTDAGYWGPAMPLASMHENLTAGTNIWVAPDGQLTPHLEVKFPTDEFDTASLANAIDARIDGRQLPVGPLELQIAYKLYLGDRTDLEDAAHLYGLFHESLSTARLESWVDTLAVEKEYARLRS
jgi:hypothetical protein